MTTEIIDKLFLELSQVTNATTKRELDIYIRLQELRKAVEPFVNLVKYSSGNIRTEKLSLAQWHDLTKAFNAASHPAQREATHD